MTWRVTTKNDKTVQSHIHGSYHEGYAAGKLIGKDAKNPYANYTDEGMAAYWEHYSAWQSGFNKAMAAEIKTD